MSIDLKFVELTAASNTQTDKNRPLHFRAHHKTQKSMRVLLCLKGLRMGAGYNFLHFCIFFP